MPADPPGPVSPAPMPARTKGVRFTLIVCGWLAFAVLAGVAATPFGGWLQSFFYGTGARWENAYVALEAAETNLPRNERDRERLLLANAMAEGDAPLDMKVGPRLHRPGTLARLRYELFDENGARMNTWEVRALVPNIGNGQGPFWRKPCARACVDEIARGSGTHILRSGEAGIAEEYVLRMPVGKTLQLRPTSLQTQDILDAKPRRVPLGSVRVDGVTVPVPVPSKILVTLVEACAGEVRVGTAMNLEFNESVTVPIPRGFRVSRWAQLDGCGRLKPFAPPPEEPRVYARNVIVDPPGFRAVAAHRDAVTGAATLKVDEAWLQKHNLPVMFHISILCRYDAAADQWQRLPDPDPRRSWRLAPLSDADAAAGNRVAYEVPRETALFWLHWSEQHELNTSSSNTAYRDALVVSGHLQCNDVALGPAPQGKVAACVPFANRAEARFVPEPARACRQ